MIFSKKIQVERVRSEQKMQPTSEPFALTPVKHNTMKLRHKMKSPTKELHDTDYHSN